MADVLIDDRILTVADQGPRLIGSRCVDCGTYAFPAQDGCAKCTGTNVERVELGTEGTLWTWTVQGFPPKSPPYAGNADPATFEPFGVGYVELHGQIKIEARLTESSPERLHIGMPMHLVLVPLTIDAHGNRVMTFAFAPNEGSN
jgi:uncharacterized OB-fold protein